MGGGVGGAPTSQPTHGANLSNCPTYYWYHTKFIPTRKQKRTRMMRIPIHHLTLLIVVVQMMKMRRMMMPMTVPMPQLRMKNRPWTHPFCHHCRRLQEAVTTPFTCQPYQIGNRCKAEEEDSVCTPTLARKRVSQSAPHAHFLPYLPQHHSFPFPFLLMR